MESKALALAALRKAQVAAGLKATWVGPACFGYSCPLSNFFRDLSIFRHIMGEIVFKKTLSCEQLFKLGKKMEWHLLPGFLQCPRQGHCQAEREKEREERKTEFI